MALINIESALTRILSQLKKLPANQGIEILSYKRNRGLSLVRLEGNAVHVRERGYREEELVVELTDLAKILKSIMKIEFPRSRKVRVYQISGPDEQGPPRKKL